jgi:hypothetical protein
MHLVPLRHGLRLILTFKPETSFLVPLDRCIQLMKTILAAPPVPNLKGAEALVEHRQGWHFSPRYFAVSKHDTVQLMTAGV